MRILIVDDCCSLAARICQAYRELGIEVEQEPVALPKAHLYEPREYPASSKYVREKDWVQERSKNQYKQKRRGKK
jgi:hypothetical protein